ncbi:MAG: hypothetical protein JWN48_1340 [Myxococcaceae bacterium]|nr:hypothetical protein [Myxococcaceae bacterium]
MHFEVEHVFNAPVAAVEAAMFHPDYPSFLIERSDVLKSHALKSFEDDGMRIRRKVQHAPRPAFDRIGTKEVPAEWFEFIEDSTWDRSLRKLTFENIPITDKIASRLINRGEVTLVAVSPGQTKRVARGEIKLHGLPLLARPFVPMIEQMLAREAKRMLEAEAAVMHEWLAAHAAQPIIHA